MMSQKDLARALGVSQGRVSRLRRQGMPTDSVAAAEAWRRANVGPYEREGATTAPAPPAADAAGPPALSLGQERAQLARSQREAIDLKNRVARGEFAPVGLLADVLAAASAAVADRLDALPGQLRKACPDLPAEAREVIDRTIASARNEWIKGTFELAVSRLDELAEVEGDATEDSVDRARNDQA